MKEEELQALHARLKEVRPLTLYPTMAGHAEAVAETKSLRERIRAEEERRAGLEGRQLVERQLQDTADLIEANRRMAEASEAAAMASAEAARWAKWAAIFTAVAAALTLVGTLVQVRGR